jgi:hypothetical protein
MLDAIAADAVLKAAPKLVGAGVVVGGVIVVGARTAVTQSHAIKSRMTAVRVAAIEARAELRKRLSKDPYLDGENRHE